MIQTLQTLLERYTDIRSETLMGYAGVLASDMMRGRMPGDSGYRLAMDYVIQCFRNNGVQPGLADGTYEQPFCMETCRVRSAEVVLETAIGETRRLSLGADYVCRGLTGDGDVSGEPAFVGYCSDDEEFNELNGVDLDGKIAVSFKHPPPWHETRRPVLPRRKAHLLRERGAVGLVIVPNPNLSRPERLSASLVEEGEYIPGFPMIVLADQPADAMMHFDNQTLAGRQFAIDTERRICSGPVPGRISIRIDTEHASDGLSWNAVGYLPGTDPEIADECVVIGAHLDHVGIQGESVIFNGAQDNASGVAAVLEIARTFAAGPRPRRSLRFVLFGAEEAGLLGSMHYAKNAPHPLDRTPAMLNLDCMGAGSGGDFRGRSAHPHLFEILDEMNSKFVNVPDTRADHPAGGADAKPFEDAGIPNVYFVTSDAYRHLHMAGDTVDTLNPGVFEKITRLAYLTAANLVI
ncbi:MAG TPA: M20/M25/M40 family metallo-hydrolase [bacterium]|nr:M20/M25/M40 family metallo-hydrolase [bacterium]